MSINAFDVVAALAIVVLVISQQLRGQRVRASRVIGLPIVLTAIGLYVLVQAGFHPTGTDLAFLAVDVVLAVGIGVAQGTVIRLEQRAGGLWLTMPRTGLWLWAAFLVSRIAVMLIAHQAGAVEAASVAPLLVMLGLNRMSQGVVVGRRVLAIRAGTAVAVPAAGQGQ